MFGNAIVEMSCKERGPKMPLIVQKAICLVHFDHKKSGTSKPTRIACRMSYHNFKFKVPETGTSKPKIIIAPRVRISSSRWLNIDGSAPEERLSRQILGGTYDLDKHRIISD